MERNKNKNSIKTILKSFSLLPVFMAVLATSVVAPLTAVYVVKEDIAFLIVAIVILVFLLFGYVFVIFYISRMVREIFFNQIYKKTYRNFKKIVKNDTSFERYDDQNIVEIDELNEMVDDLKKKLDGGFLVIREQDYSSLNLEYIDKSKKLITFDSFKKNIAHIIYLSQSFRNMVISISYPIDQPLEEEDKNRILNLYTKVFEDYSNHLFVYGEDGKSLLIYLPVISSLSRVKEQLELSLPDSGVVVRGVNGLENYSPKFAAVVYPYSTEEYILSDLRYANRQDKQINFFIPNRTERNSEKDTLMNTSMNVNYMSKIVSCIHELNYDTVDNEKNIKVLKKLVNDLASYHNVDEAGIIYYNEALKAYMPYVTADNSNLFKVGDKIDPYFVNLLANNADPDNSYYFFSRNHANNLLGRQFDLYGITSGFYQLARNRNGFPISLVYFFNRKGVLNLNSYLRESFFVICSRLAGYFNQKEGADYVDVRNSENEYILSMSDYMMYKVNDDFNLVYLSNGLKKAFPKSEVGKPCHKCFYGLDRPCHDCPIKTYKKKSTTINKSGYDISLTLNDRKSPLRTLLCARNDSSSEINTKDLFDREFLTFSYLSLLNTLKNEYYSNGRGYILLISIDNSEDFISSQGSEGFLFATRCLIRNIKNKLKTNDVFIYNPTTLAIHLANKGHADILNICENIYELSKEHYFDDGSKDRFNLTYLPIGYPRGYASADDFIRHMSDVYHNTSYDRNKDFIYFCDYPISRSASKRDFMLSVIENEFSGQTSNSVNLQPIVSVKNRHIFGAEILLRINDVHRNIFFNAEEISRIAESENKTHIITESIVNFVGKLYKDYGKSILKLHDFGRIAINIDQTYLKDPNLIKAVIKLCEANNLPNNFISFEIPEEMIPDNIDKIKRFADELSNYHIYFSVDRYTGAHIGSEKLKDLGFNEVKIARDLITKIDKDPIQLKAVADIVKNAKNVGISIACVGVENEAQFKALKNLDNEMVVQGYYLYKPLTRSDLISAIIS